MTNKYGFLLMLLASLTIRANAETSIEELIRESDNGSKYATYTLAVKYAEGDGVKENREIAFSLYNKGAILNHAPSQNNLGWYYRQGIATKKDERAAIFWFRLSALQGNALALQNLAEMFMSGEGVKADYLIARDLFTLCATRNIRDEIGRESGFNNAIHECRRELGKMWAIETKDEQKALSYASLWLSASLVDNDDIKEDSDVGAKARKSRKETIETLKKINNKLTSESKKKVAKNLKDWETFKWYVEDVTPFPLIETDVSTKGTNL